jgi:hypothetical protein
MDESFHEYPPAEHQNCSSSSRAKFPAGNDRLLKKFSFQLHDIPSIVGANDVQIPWFDGVRRSRERPAKAESVGAD